MPKPILTPPEAAEYLCVAVQTLAHWRVQGQGPCYLKYGRLVRYRHEDLERWAGEQQRAHTSAPTSGRVVTLRRPEQEP